LQAGIEFAGLVYAHQFSVTIGQAVHDLELIAKWSFSEVKLLFSRHRDSDARSNSWWPVQSPQ
jgi:hypothetical protein